MSKGFHESKNKIGWEMLNLSINIICKLLRNAYSQATPELLNQKSRGEAYQLTSPPSESDAG